MRGGLRGHNCGRKQRGYNDGRIPAHASLRRYPYRCIVPSSVVSIPSVLHPQLDDISIGQDVVSPHHLAVEGATAPDASRS